MTKLDISDEVDGFGAEQTVELIKKNNTALQLLYLYKNLENTIFQINKPDTDYEKINYNHILEVKTKIFDLICQYANVPLEISDKTIENVINKW